MMKRIKEDLNVDTELALCWALNAKNSLENYGGYSPSQLAMGSKNPSIPYLSNSTLLDRKSSQIDGDIVNWMQKARTAFTEANHSSKFKRALKSKVENSSCSHVKTGDKVYYKRSVDDWYAKGIVVGQIGTIVWIERGGQTYKAHHTKVKKREDGTSQEMIQNSQQNERRTRNKIMTNSNHEEKHERKNTGNQQRTRLRSSEERKHVDLDSSESEWSSDQEDQRTLVTELESQRASVSEPRNERASVSEPEIEEILAVESIGECTDLRAKHELIARQSVEIAEIEPNSNMEEDENFVLAPEPGKSDDMISSDKVQCHSVNTDVGIKEQPWGVSVIFNSSSPLKKRNDGRYRLSAGDEINYEYEDSVHSAKVLSRSGKVTSETLKNRFNVESDGQSMSLNLEHVLCVEKMLEESIQICYEEDSFSPSYLTELIQKFSLLKKRN